MMQPRRRRGSDVSHGVQATFNILVGKMVISCRSEIQCVKPMSEIGIV